MRTTLFCNPMTSPATRGAFTARPGPASDDLVLDPTKVRGFPYSGDCYIGQDDDELSRGSRLQELLETTARARAAWEQDPNNSQLAESYELIVRELAQEQWRAEQWDAVVQSSRTLMRFAPYATSMRLLAAALYEYSIHVLIPAKNYHRAVETMREACLLDPDINNQNSLAVFLVQLAAQEMEDGRIDAAKAHLDEALPLKRHEQGTYVLARNLGVFAILQLKASSADTVTESNETAIAYLEKGHELLPTDDALLEALTLTLKNHGLALAQSGNPEVFDRAAVLIRRAWTLKTDETFRGSIAGSLSNVAMLQHSSGEMLRVGAVILLALECCPETHPYLPSMQDNLVLILKSLTDDELRQLSIPKAVAYLRKVQALQPENPELRFLLTRLMAFN